MDAATVLQSSTTNTVAKFPITLSVASPSTITVHYTTSDSTDGGKAGEDYVAKSGTVTFPPGTTTQYVDVTVLPESGADADEGLEHFYLNISNATGGGIISCSKGTVAIQPPVINITGTNPAPIDQSTSSYVPVYFPVTLSSPATTPVTVKYTTANGTATSADYLPISGTLTFPPGVTTVKYTTANGTATSADYLPISGTLTFPPGVTTEDVKVWVKPGTAKTDRTFFVNLTAPAGAPGLKITMPQLTGKIIGQNSENTPTIQVDSIFITRSATQKSQGYFTISLSTASTHAVSVHYVLSNGTASAGTDYITQSSTVTFPPGVTSVQVPVTVMPGTNTDNMYFYIDLSNPVGAPIGSIRGRAIIIPSMIGVSAYDAPAVQQSGMSNGTATFTIRLSGNSSTPITVDYVTMDGSAKHGVDYVMTTGSVTFPPYTGAKTVNVTILPGSSMVDRTFTLNLTNVSGGSNVSIVKPQATGTILGHPCGCMCINVNDAEVTQSTTSDTTLTFTITLTNPVVLPVTVDYMTSNPPHLSNGGGGALPGVTYNTTSGTVTFSPGQTSQTVNVTVLPGPNTGMAQTVYLNLTNPNHAMICRAQGVGTIYPPTANLTVSTNNAPPVQRSLTSGMTATFTVSLSSTSSSPVTVKYTTSDGSATKNVDYTPVSGTLTFPPGSKTMTVNVPVLAGAQTGNKTFYLNLSSPTGASIATAQGSALIYPPNSTEPTVNVNDITVLQSGTKTTTATFTVSLTNASSSPVTVQYTTANGNTGGDGFTAVSGTLTFAPGQTTKSVPVTLPKEPGESTPEYFFLNISNATNAMIGKASGRCTIVPPVINVSIAGPAAIQPSPMANTTDAFMVSLTSVCTTPITVEYTTKDSSAVHGVDYVAKSGTLTFSPGTTTLPIDVTILPSTKTAQRTFTVDLTAAVGPGVSITTGSATAQIK